MNATEAMGLHDLLTDVAELLQVASLVARHGAARGGSAPAELQALVIRLDDIERTRERMRPTLIRLGAIEPYYCQACDLRFDEEEASGQWAGDCPSCASSIAVVRAASLPVPPVRLRSAR